VAAKKTVKYPKGNVSTYAAMALLSETDTEKRRTGGR
jgi:hypothetical protein